MESRTKLGHYEISTLLGKRGMGEVWRARDTKLGREVAIKTLPEEFAKDADRLARFEREAKLLASLNHPNIAAIHGFEEDNGTHFLVLELVEGDTLADQIKRVAIPVEDSLKRARQIAEALEAAHEKGVIDRDLKPANIKVTEDGKVKVLDFGLAKAFEGDASDAGLSNSPTLSMAATQQGVILGTAGYMSPEQAKGAEVSHQPTRQRERQMRRFKSPRQAQLFVSVPGAVLNRFRLATHRLKAVHHRLVTIGHRFGWRRLS